MRLLNSKLSQQLLPLALLIPLLFIYLYKVVPSYSYDSDFGRDMYDILSIAQGDFRLLGPKLSFGGIHSGPYYYYLFSPVLALFPDRPEAVLYTNAVVAWVAVVMMFVLLHGLWKSSASFALTATYVLGLSPVLLFSARQPGNAFTYQAWLVVLLLWLPWILAKSKLWVWLLYGFAWGIVLNFHFVVLLIIAAIMISLLIVQRRNSIQKTVMALLFMAIGIAFSFTPVILFDVTHDFVQFKNTFIDKSYVAFTQNSNLPSPMPTSSNIFENALNLQKYLSNWSHVSFIFLLSFVCVFAWQKRCDLDAPTKIVASSSLIAFCLLVLTARSQLAIHYLFPTASLILLSTLVLLRSTEKKVSLAIVAALCLTSLILLPIAWYQASDRQISEYRETTQQILDSQMGTQLASSPFAVYVTREISLAPLGWEYRYFLRTHHLLPVDPSAYATATSLLWIAEQPSADFLSTQSWELDQFGPRQLQSETMISGRKMLLFAKESVQ